jgi:hypothetical protein
MEASQFKGELVAEENLDSSSHVCIFFRTHTSKLKSIECSQASFSVKGACGNVVLVGWGICFKQRLVQTRRQKSRINSPACIFVSSVSIAS